MFRYCPILPRTVRSVTCMFLLPACVTVARANDIQWNNASGGTFQSGGNWSGSNAPGPTDTALFDLSTAGYTVTFSAGPTNERLVVGNDNVTFDLGGFTYTLTDTGFPAGSPVLVGEQSLENGFLTVTNGTLAANGVTIGVSGHGQLNIESAQVTTDLPSHIASLTGSVGDVVVGAGSSWTMTDHLIIGQSGVGSLTVENGGAVSTTWCNLGNISDGEGTLLITGPSTFSFNDALSVGANGEGTLSVSAGGQLLSTGGSDFLVVGNIGVGTATITGVGTLLDVTGHSILVGYANQGDVIVSAGAQVITGYAPGSGGVGGFIGDDPGGDGEVTVTGTGSQWVTNQQIQVGHDGAIGVVRVQAGGYLETHKDISASNSSAIIGFDAAGSNPPGSGTIIVQDSGSSWITDGAVNVGWNDFGGLQILSGGDVSSVDGIIGRVAGADGTATIDGTGSTWTVSDSMYVGGMAASAGGIGELAVSNGGAVSVQNLCRVWPQGTLTVTGGSFTVLTGSVQSDGTLRGTATITSDVSNATGSVSPGLSAGILTIDGDYSQSSGATLDIEIGGLVAGTQYDRLAITGTANLGGTLTISLISGFLPTAGDTFQVMTYASRTGTFASVVWPGVAFTVRYESTGVFMDVEANAPLPAPSPHDVAKNRYISFDPNNSVTPVAFEVNMTASAYTGPTGVVGWVGTPGADGVSEIVGSPVTRAWPEAVIHVGSCEIAPVASYNVRATGDSGGSFSSALAVSTIADPSPTTAWGDIVAPFAVVGQPNFLDVAQVVFAFQGLPTALHFARVDLDPQWPNGIVNTTDIYQVYRAFQASAYPFTTSCAICFCKTNSDCDDGQFCNGQELCTNCSCLPGVSPCSSGCDEGLNTCAVPNPDLPKISFVPVDASVGHSISGDEITLNQTPAWVKFEIRVEDWDADLSGSPTLAVVQATLDPTGLLGANASPPNAGVNLTPRYLSCPSVDGAGNSFCRTDFGEPSPSSSLQCRPAAEIFGCPFTNCCAPMYRDAGRGDRVLPSGISPYVRLLTADIAWGEHADPGGGPFEVDPGTVRYTATFALQIPPGAGGTYTISPKTGSFDSFLSNPAGLEIAGGQVIPARVSIVSPIIYVKAGANGANNGTSWANAYRYLQDALAAASPGSEVWVAQGTYKPDRGPGVTLGDRTATFQLQNGVEVYGGFVGSETLLSQRDPALNTSILSGDLTGDDTPVACMQNSPDCDSFGGLCRNGICIISDNNDENTYHVVTGSGTDNTAVLDGFKITAGNADGTAPSRGGGGMINLAGSPTVINCTFIGNHGDDGGGMVNFEGSATVNNCTFRDNSAANGGGMNNNNCSPIVKGCTFSGNSAADDGGGMLNYNKSNPSVINCAFTGNSATESGGGMFNWNSSPTLANCAFAGNSGALGGGMENFDDSNPALTNCAFSGNRANNIGGGVYNQISSSPTVSNSIFWGNIDDADGNAGGPFVDESAQIHTVNGAPTVNFSIVQGGWSGAGGNNLSSDPLFFDPDGADDLEGTIDDNLRLRAGSSAIDAGGDASVPADALDLDGDLNVAEPIPFDLADNARFVGTVDMGAYEYFTDCNNNGILDADDIAGPFSEDCDSTGWPGNGIPDECDITACAGDPGCDDCNLNDVPDGCDIGSGFSLDTTPADSIPDECSAFTDTCAVPGQEQFWTCGDNWSLGGDYPDDDDSAEGVSVTLPDGVVALLNETVVIPSLRIEEGAELRITQTGAEGDLDFSAPARFDVNGSVVVAGDRTIGGGVNPEVTIGPAGVFQADGAAVASAGVISASLASSNLRLIGNDCYIPPCPNGGKVILTDSMSVTTTGDLILDGSLANGHCHLDERNAAARVNHTPPTIRLSDSNTRFTAGSNVVLSGAAGFLNESLLPFEVGGNWQNQSVRPDCFEALAGTIRMDGSIPQDFEAAAADIGGSSNDFRIGTLEIAAGSDVTIRDSFDNDLQGQASCGEAQYVGTLVLEVGATLTVQNCRLYYDVLEKDPSAQIIQVGCGEAREAQNPDAVTGDPTGLNKARVISFIPPAGAVAGGSGARAIRVTLASLHRVVPPYTGGPSIPFTSFEGEVRWVGPPIQYVESSASQLPFYASQLQCTPHYRDWSTVGLLHAFGSAITPSSSYRVQTVAGACVGIEPTCTAVSPPLIVKTTRWGDVRAPYNPSDPSVQPDISDVSALVDKFRSAPGAPIKARGLLAGAPGNPFGEITHDVLNVDFGFSHISACVDAFRGVPYPYMIATCP